jgi:hypothetical protein
MTAGLMEKIVFLMMQLLKTAAGNSNETIAPSLPVSWAATSSSDSIGRSGMDHLFTSDKETAAATSGMPASSHSDRAAINLLHG